MDESLPEFRAARPDEYADVLNLWTTVWGMGALAYFRAYLEGDPWLKEPYCQIARLDGKIVSGVNICRRPLRLNGREIFMGGIANVATLPEYRRRGLSAELLRRAVEVMESEDFAFSALGTGYHSHYARHGWFQINQHRYELDLKEDGELPDADPDVQPLSAEQWLEEAPPVYAAFNATLPLFFERSLEYWNGWLRIRAEGADANSLALGLRRHGVLEGYLRGHLPNEPGGRAGILEGAALEPEGWAKLFAGAVRAARSAGAAKLSIRAPKIDPVDAALSPFGDLTMRQETGTMLRRVHADEAMMQDIIRYHESGAACWWDPDGY
jgi:predicted acetyltransferase